MTAAYIHITHPVRLYCALVASDGKNTATVPEDSSSGNDLLNSESISIRT